MATTLALLRDRAEAILADSSNAIWSTDDVDEAIRQALHEYTRANPLQQITTLTLSADAREIDTSSISGLLDIYELWVPYDSSDPQFPPNTRQFRYWPDSSLVYVTSDYEPANGDVVRLFYTAMQTLNGLDSASTTTLPVDDETLLAHGAAGFAALTRSVDLTEQVTVDRETVTQLRTWGKGKVDNFRGLLRAVARQRHHIALVPTPNLDRHDDQWA